MVCERCFVGEVPIGKGILVTCNGIIERPESQNDREGRWDL